MWLERPISHSDDMKTLSVLMPVHNESRTLRTIVKRVFESQIDLEIELICVDDGSSDDSLAILEELASDNPRILVIRHGSNMGKGKAVRSAIEKMTGDIAIIQDADLEYDPNDYARVLAPILNGDADAVYGSRFAASEVRRVLFFWHSVGNKVLTTLSNMANNHNLTDLSTCYKAVRGDLLKGLRLTSDGFGIDPELTARLTHSGARLYEVPISYYGRTYSEGKHIGWRDGFEALWLIFKFKFIDTKSDKSAGHASLESLAASPKISSWMLNQFRPFLGRDVFEAGCGSGNITENLLGSRSLRAVDLDEGHVGKVRKRFGHLDNVEVESGNLENPDLYKPTSSVDSVVCINVLEHLDHPEAAVAGFHELLRSEGHALILVPAHDWLYSVADDALEHRKRYTEEEVEDLLTEAGFEIIDCHQFNRLGVAGWATNKLLKKTSITTWQAKIFGWILPLARLVEKVNFLPGLSVVAVARKV